MILLTTQEGISPIVQFLVAPIPYGAVIIGCSIIVTVLFCVFSLRSYYRQNIKSVQVKSRGMERAVADLEAKDAQVKEELDDLRRAEAILIHRNGLLDAQIKEYAILCAQQEKRLSTMEALFSR